MMEKTQQHEHLVDALFEILEAFPTLENQIKDLFTSFLFGEITVTEFDGKVKTCCLAHIKKQTQIIRKGVKKDNLYKAYYDVARYQTNVKDAADEWGVDEEVLGFILTQRPPPTSPEQRRQLSVPSEVTKKRVLMC